MFTVVMSLPSNVNQKQYAFPCRYCSDQTSADCTSAKLLPKHETLSICNTPKTLAKAKLHDVKHTVSKNQTSQNEMCDQPASTSSADKLDQSEQSKKKKLR